MKTAERKRTRKLQPRELRELVAEATAEQKQQTAAERAKSVMDARARALASAPNEAAGTGHYIETVAFMLGDERYGIETCHVREVVRMTDVTPVPGTPDFLLGVTNLRGEILAVIDLRKLFGVPAQALTDSSRLIVLGLEQPEFGMLADAVIGVLRMPAGKVLEPPETVSGVGREYLRGVTQDGLVLLDGVVLPQDERLFIDEQRS